MRGRPFRPGEVPNPKGRPKGSRNKLGEAFIADLYASWQEHGPETIEQVRTEKPDAYLKVVASILPKELNVRVSDLDDLSLTDLDKRITALLDALRLEVGIGAAAGGEATAAGEGSSQPLSTLQ